MKEYAPKNLLVTGGAGFIGSNFVHQMLAAHPDVRLVTLDLLTYAGSLDNLSGLPAPERHLFVQGDICDYEKVLDLLRRHEIDTIVHFAAESHVDRSIADPSAFIRTNVMGTFELLRAAFQYWLKERSFSEKDCRFHHISTDEVYGSLDRQAPPFDEQTRYDPSSPYSASKAGSDHLVSSYLRTYRLPITLSNCSNNYGPRQHHEKFIPTVIRSCLEGKKIPVYGDGSNIRDWLHVSDHINAIDTVLRKGTVGHTYCVGANNERSNRDIALTICGLLNEMRPNKAFRYETLVSFVPDRPGHDWRYAVNFTKTRRETGWIPKKSFEEGLRETIQWYLEHCQNQTEDLKKVRKIS